MSSENFSSRNRFIKAIEYILKSENLKKIDVAKNIGITPSSLSEITSGRTASPGKQTVMLLELRFGIRQKWIETGEGEMLLSDEEKAGRVFDTFGERLIYALACIGDDNPAQEIWKHAHIEQSNWDDVANGVTVPDIDYLKKLKKYYGRGSFFSWILTGEGYPPESGGISVRSNPFLDIEKTTDALHELETSYVSTLNEKSILQADLTLALMEIDNLSLTADESALLQAFRQSTGDAQKDILNSARSWGRLDKIHRKPGKSAPVATDAKTAPPHE